MVQVQGDPSRDSAFRPRSSRQVSDDTARTFVLSAESPVGEAITCAILCRFAISGHQQQLHRLLSNQHAGCSIDRFFSYHGTTSCPARQKHLRRTFALTSTEQAKGPPYAKRPLQSAGGNHVEGRAIPNGLAGFCREA